MTIERWTPVVAPTKQEQFILKRLGRVRKLLGFLRLHRHELFDDACQDELATMYRTTGAGKAARPPAMLAMAMLVQGYLGISDAETIELTVLDLRVQMVLGCLGARAPPFSQGALQEFRERVIAADIGQTGARADRRVGEADEGPYDRVPGRPRAAHQVRRDRRVRSGYLRSLHATPAMHHRRTRQRPHGGDCRKRRAAATPAQTAPNVGGTRRRAGTHDHRTQARAYFATTRQPRAVHRCPQEHLRSPPSERHPKSGDTPSLGDRIAKGCLMSALLNRSAL